MDFEIITDFLLNQNSSFDDIYSSLTNSILYVPHTSNQNQGWQKQRLNLGENEVSVEKKSRVSWSFWLKYTGS